jgi:hypothetical protein
MLKFRNCIAAFAIYFAAIGYVQSQQPSPGENESSRPQQSQAQSTQKQATPDQRGTQQAPLVVKVLPSPKTDEETDQEAKDRNEKSANDRELIRYSRDLDILTAVLIAVGVLQLFVFAYQAMKLRQTVSTMDATAERQLRAYISITARNVLNWNNVGGRIGVQFDIENHGQTPGFEILYDYSMLILKSPLPTDFVWPPTDKRYDQNNSLFPGTKVPVQIFLDRDLTAPERGAIEEGESRFHTRGTMSYRDAFGETRTTKFSFSFGGFDFARGMRNPKHEWRWSNDQTHNDAT